MYSRYADWRRVEIDSIVGQGTRIRIVLPLSDGSVKGHGMPG